MHCSDRVLDTVVGSQLRGMSSTLERCNLQKPYLAENNPTYPKLIGNTFHLILLELHRISINIDCITMLSTLYCKTL